MDLGSKLQRNAKSHEEARKTEQDTRNGREVVVDHAKCLFGATVLGAWAVGTG